MVRVIWRSVDEGVLRPFSVISMARMRIPLTRYHLTHDCDEHLTLA
jgi:hypothetical protein